MLHDAGFRRNIAKTGESKLERPDCNLVGPLPRAAKTNAFASGGSFSSSPPRLTIAECPEDRVEDLVEPRADVFGEESEDSISVLLE